MRWLLLAVCLVVGGSAGAQETPTPVPASAPAPAPVQPKPTIRGGIVAGKLIHSVPPVYPEKAKAAGVDGQVVLKGIIGKDGVLRDLQVISGPELLRQAAVDATSHWIYSPYLLNGEPTEVDTTVAVNFNLGRKADGPVRISGGVEAGLLLSKVQPVYPDAARGTGAQGLVTVRTIIGKDGAVKQATAMSGPEVFRESAVDAVRQWRYKPYLLNGQPIDVDTIVNVMYTSKN